MKVKIQTIPHEGQRYNTCGDYFDIEGAEIVLISDLGNKKFERCIAIHELVEKWVCEDRGISEESITAFDVEYEKNRPEGDVSEPGNSRDAPYHLEHKLASQIELLLAEALGVNLDEYNAAVENL